MVQGPTTSPETGTGIGTETETGQDNKVDISALSAHNETQLERRYTTP